MNKYARPKIAVFASGAGSTFRATAEAVAKGLVGFDIALVITDHNDAGVLDQVTEVNKLFDLKIKTKVINKNLYPDKPNNRGQTGEEAEATIEALKNNKIDHLALMGCMRIIAQSVIEEYGWRPEFAKKDPKSQGIYYSRMSNTHSGILPQTTDTFGIHIQEKVLELGLSRTAHTVHVVASGVDTGPIIAEHFVQVSNHPKETAQSLFDKVRKVERDNLPKDIDKFLKEQKAFLEAKE